MFNDNVPMNKLGLKREQMTNHEYLGSDMIEAGNEFGPDTQYGSALIRVGQAEKRWDGCQDRVSNLAARYLALSEFQGWRCEELGVRKR